MSDIFFKFMNIYQSGLFLKDSADKFRLIFQIKTEVCMTRKQEFYRNIMRLCNGLSEKVCSVVEEAMSLFDELAKFIASIEYVKFAQEHKHAYQKTQKPMRVLGGVKTMINGKRLHAKL